jgi:hypothetical protein
MAHQRQNNETFPNIIRYNLLSKLEPVNPHRHNRTSGGSDEFPPRMEWVALFLSLSASYLVQHISHAFWQARPVPALILHRIRPLTIGTATPTQEGTTGPSATPTAGHIAVGGQPSNWTIGRWHFSPELQRRWTAGHADLSCDRHPGRAD